MRELNKHGFKVRELTAEDTEEIFEILKEELGHDSNKSVQNKKLRTIKREIDFTFNEDEHHFIGIEANGNLVGVATCNDENNIPWLGHFVIKKNHRKTKAMALLLYYIMGIVYPGKIIQTNPIGDTSDYENTIKKMPKELGFSIINPERFKILKKIAGE